jgi:hypothetical protein
VDECLAHFQPYTMYREDQILENRRYGPVDVRKRILQSVMLRFCSFTICTGSIVRSAFVAYAALIADAAAIHLKKQYVIK